MGERVKGVRGLDGAVGAGAARCNYCNIGLKTLAALVLKPWQHWSWNLGNIGALNARKYWSKVSATFCFKSLRNIGLKCLRSTGLKCLRNICPKRLRNVGINATLVLKAIEEILGTGVSQHFVLFGDSLEVRRVHRTSHLRLKNEKDKRHETRKENDQYQKQKLNNDFNKSTITKDKK